jgi:hypothetical protein
LNQNGYKGSFDDDELAFIADRKLTELKAQGFAKYFPRAVQMTYGLIRNDYVKKKKC